MSRGQAGFREVQTFYSVTTGTLDRQASYVEVTNNGSTDIIFYPNDFPNSGHPTANVASKGIPVKAETTREIPMLLFNFVASGPITLVAYMQ
jgi:hypothetical protein